MMKGVFPTTPHADSANVAMASRSPMEQSPPRRRNRDATSARIPYNAKPWMTCENVYQSARCWEFSELAATPCHNLTYPHLQMSTRPISHSAHPASAMIAMTSAAYAQRLYCRRLRKFPYVCSGRIAASAHGHEDRPGRDEERPDPRLPGKLLPEEYEGEDEHEND